jgi:hypothetical protein
MNMKKITKRDVGFFLLGIVTFFVFELIYDWEGNKAAFKEGFEAATNKTPIEQIK